MFEHDNADSSREPNVTVSELSQAEGNFDTGQPPVRRDTDKRLFH